MNRRGGKREGAGRKKSPALAKITQEINQKHWKANHQYIYLENRVFSTWRKLRTKTSTVISASFLNIFRAVLNIYTGKKCSEYLLISFVE